MNSIIAAKQALLLAWSKIQHECLAILGSELHYQAMVYHYLIIEGGVPMSQLGMNVKIYIEDPISELFKNLTLKRDINYQGGFEPIPDVAIFKKSINSDWRRRNNVNTLTKMLLAIEIKASERHKSRLRPKEIITDLEKLDAHREEAEYKGGELFPVMMVIDSAPFEEERMTSKALNKVVEKAKNLNVGLLYCSRNKLINTIA